MVYRDLSAALARVEHLEAELVELRAKPERSLFDWLSAYVFTVVVAGLAMSVLISSWLYNTS